MSHSSSILPYRRGAIRRRIHHMGHLLIERVVPRLGPAAFSLIRNENNRAIARVPHTPTGLFHDYDRRHARGPRRFRPHQLSCSRFPESAVIPKPNSEPTSALRCASSFPCIATR